MNSRTPSTTHSVDPSGIFEAASRLLLSESSAPMVTSELLRLLQELIAADAYAMWRHDPRDSSWYVAESFALRDEFLAGIQPTGDPAQYEWLAGSPLVLSSEDPRLATRRQAYEAEAIRTLVIFPLRNATTIIGTLVCYFRDQRTFDDSELRSAMAFANLAATAMTHADVRVARAAAEQELRQRERLYRALAEASTTPQAIWIADPNGRIVSDSPSWRAITGQSEEEWLSQGWSQLVHPDDVAAVVALSNQAYAERVICDIRYRLRQRNGTYRWFAAKMVPVIADDGELEAWVATASDAHDHVMAQERLAFLAQASELMAASLDYESTLQALAQQVVPRLADWCTIDMLGDNGELRRLVTWHNDPEKRVFAEEFRRKYPPGSNDAGGPAAVIRSGLASLVPEITDEMVAHAAQSDEQLALLRTLGLRSYLCVPIRVRRGVVGAITLIHSDSERQFAAADMQLAEELARRASQAIDNARLHDETLAASRAKDEFLATLSHELRTPLTAILGWATLLNENLDSETFRTAVQTIKQSAKAQAELIDDVLDVSRIVTGKLQLTVIPLDLGALVQSACEAVRPAAEGKGIRLSFLSDGSRFIAHADLTRMQQILWNLLTNAIKFTPADGSVDVELTRDGSMARIRVRDTGRGILPDFLPHVFAPFRQQDESTTRSHGGLGLGLAVVHYLVQAHGGVVSATSEGADKGATFTVELPLRSVGSETMTRAAKELRSNGHDGAPYPDLNGMRIMVVDDQADARALVRTILERCGASVIAADSASAGVEAFSLAGIDGRLPDLIVSDIAMPGGDGYELLRSIRAQPNGANVPLIALTAFGRAQDSEAALASGFSDYLKKPVEPHLLATTVARRLQR